jgi:hypothetical protein
MKTNILKERSYAFALRVIKMCRFLAAEQRDFVLSKQVLRSGTSIGANIEEAYQGESKLDFIHKLSIANKEAYLKSMKIATDKHRIVDCTSFFTSHVSYLTSHMFAHA